jgi:hypothetical protein
MERSTSITQTPEYKPELMDAEKIIEIVYALAALLEKLTNEK